jgi:hypothetical protein
VAQIKGITTADLRAFVESHDAVERLRALLEPPDRRWFDEAVAVAWYPLDHQMHALAALPEAIGQSELDALRAFGRFSAARHVTRVHRVFFRFASPAYVLEKAGEFWSRFYDTGVWTVTREGPKRVRGELRGFGLPNEAHCTFLTAYIGALFENVGARGVRCVHPVCEARGAGVCSFVADWL